MTANYADQYNNGEIEEVFPRIWRVPVPLPDNPLNYLNSYFILSDDKTTIVDVGFDHPDCEKALDDALRKLGRTWESVEIVLTHSHPDHTSNLDRIWRRWMRIYANMHSIQEVQNLMNMQATVFNPLIGYLTHPNTYDERSMQARDASTYRVSAELLPLKNQPDLFYLADGDVYHNGSYRFRVITTPGHDDWHICLYEPTAKILIAGDHVLERITPTIMIQLILQIGSLMSVGYEKTLLIYNPTNYEVSDIISTYNYRMGLELGDWSYATAIGLFNSVVNCILLVISNKLSKKYTESSLW